MMKKPCLQFPAEHKRILGLYDTGLPPPQGVLKTLNSPAAHRTHKWIVHAPSREKGSGLHVKPEAVLSAGSGGV